MKKILFLHGFFATGSCPMARALKKAFEGTAVGIPALLGNPYFMMTEFLKERIGEHYNLAFHFPGGHTPTEQEVKTWYAPLAQKMLMEFSANFQSFHGGRQIII